MSNPNMASYGSISRFKKGTSGNPNGRPKGSHNLKTILEKYLSEEISIETINGKKKLPVIDHIVLNLIKNALKGDIRATQEILDRYFGKNKIETESASSSTQIVGFKFTEVSAKNYL